MDTSAQNSCRIRRRNNPSHMPVGSLRDRAEILAVEVQKSLVDAQHLVWADDQHVVHVSRGEPPDLPTHWIVGNYMMGASTSAIAQDLSAMWRDRSEHFIIE